MLYIISSSTSERVLFTDADDPVSSNLVMTTVTMVRGSATESSLLPCTVTSVPPLSYTINNKLNTNTNSDLYSVAYKWSRGANEMSKSNKKK